MAKFEIPSKAPTTEREGDISDDEQQQKYRDLEQEVKDAEPGRSKGSTAEETTETKAEAKAQKSDAKEAEARAASAASAASTAAAYGKSIKKDHAAASVGTVATEVQEAKGKEDKILALIQERKSTAKNEKGKIREISKEIKKCIRDNKRSKRQEKIQKILEEVKLTRNISSFKSVKKRILIAKVKNKEGEAVRRDRESRMYLRNSMKICVKVKKVTLKKTWTRALKMTKQIPANTTPSQSLQKKKFKMPSTD